MTPVRPRRPFGRQLVKADDLAERLAHGQPDEASQNVRGGYGNAKFGERGDDAGRDSGCGVDQGAVEVEEEACGRQVLNPKKARCVAPIEPGEILVAPTTDPGWTPLFLTAAGLVTETGSPVAHGPTVAREYGIPAVICVRDATRQIETG